jgi:O-succinylbenzoate synthase
MGHVTSQLPPIDDLLASARVVTLPLTTRFRGLDEREALLLTGPQGATEFSPFVEYDDEEASAWLAAAIDFGWAEQPAPLRQSIPVNATIPAVEAGRVASILALYHGCRTAKVKVAERGQSLPDDVARVREVRRILGPEGHIRIDANAGWNVDEAEHAIHQLADFDLEYVEQPCATIDELVEMRERLADWNVLIAADESVRKAEDPLAVARAGAADLLVIKAQPLGGVHAALQIVQDAGLPVVVSSAIDTSVGLAMGAWLAASVPQLEFDCGLGTASLLAADVTRQPLAARDGAIEVRRVELDEGLLMAHRADREREKWWLARLERCYALLAN